jgi:hypothetical protein
MRIRRRDAVALAAELGYPGRIASPLVVLAETALRRGEGGDARGARPLWPRGSGHGVQQALRGGAGD